jgi:1-acyl-sn-glycerol-3-phosphate acyltransferase
MGRSWRLVATAASFVVFGAGGLIVNGLILSAIAVVCRDSMRRQRSARACIASSFRLFLGFMRFLRLVKFDIDVEAMKNLADERGTIVVANHPTLIDVVVLLAYVDQATCVVKEAVWRNPLLSWGVRIAGYIPNSDPQALIAACERSLQRNETLIIFPEATRTVPGTPLRLQRGAANIALRTNTALRLVHFKCEPTLLPKGDPWYRIPEQQPCFAMRVGGSVRARDFLRDGENISVAARRLTRALQEEFSKEICFDDRAGTRAQAAPN